MFEAKSKWSPAAVGVFALSAALALAMAMVVQGPARADATTTTTEESPADPASDAATEQEELAAEQLREGQQVYSQICSSCHQPGGTGLPGQYPPLIDNANVDDDAYVRQVVENGQQGELEVLGEIYNGVMPSFSTLSEDETEAVIAFIQADFVAPVGEFSPTSTGPVAGTELPALTDTGYIIAYLLAAGVAALVLAPRLLSENSRLNTPWLDAWLKTSVIVTTFAFLTIVVPDWALKQSAVTQLSRFGQDLIGTALWTGGLVALLLGLWYAHRESRI